MEIFIDINSDNESDDISIDSEPFFNKEFNNLNGNLIFDNLFCSQQDNDAYSYDILLQMHKNYNIPEIKKTLNQCSGFNARLDVNALPEFIVHKIINEIEDKDVLISLYDTFIKVAKKSMSASEVIDYENENLIRIFLAFEEKSKVLNCNIDSVYKNALYLLYDFSYSKLSNDTQSFLEKCLDKVIEDGNLDNIIKYDILNEEMSIVAISRQLKFNHRSENTNKQIQVPRI